MADIKVPTDTGVRLALIVDDAEENRFIAKNLLSTQGYETLEATNGEEALIHLNTSLQRIDLMILDLMMPVLDGYGVLRQLEACVWHPHVIVVSGYVGLMRKDKAKTDALANANSVMDKPIKLERFIDAIKALPQ